MVTGTRLAVRVPSGATSTRATAVRERAAENRGHTKFPRE